MGVAAAIKSRWEAAGLATYVSGGLWYGVVATENQMPYQTFLILGETFDGRSTNTTARRVSFEIHTFYKAVAGEDPQQALEEILDATEDAFDDQILTVTNRKSMIITQNDRRTFDEDNQVYRGLNEFDLTLLKSR